MIRYNFEFELLWQCVRDDDLGFDPFHETQKAFAEMMEKEEPNHQHNFQPKLLAMQHNHHRISTCTKTCRWAADRLIYISSYSASSPWLHIHPEPHECLRTWHSTYR
ncbi:uncharacterized protein LOC124364909 [Homalodisca vitripennis]|uniref:uncharacterized protein LOC124364909 n=1 Tax=Homalodisca vitripennis TaxID=197043 RepID=UPI001EEC2AF2|nr:uncharacterized protein LOC124364909 [Homalodisca vitripennis]